MEFSIAAIFELLAKYGPTVANIIKVGSDNGPMVLDNLKLLGDKLHKNGYTPIEAVSAALNMHATPPSEWTAEQYKAFWDRATPQ